MRSHDQIYGSEKHMIKSCRLTWRIVSLWFVEKKFTEVACHNGKYGRSNTYLNSEIHQWGSVVDPFLFKALFLCFRFSSPSGISTTCCLGSEVHAALAGQQTQMLKRLVEILILYVARAVPKEHHLGKQ